MRTGRFADGRVAGILEEPAAGGGPAAACRRPGIGARARDRWKREDGGLGGNEVERPKALKEENARLARLVAERALASQAPKERPRNNRWRPLRGGRRRAGGATASPPRTGAPAGRSGSTARPEGGRAEAMGPVRPVEPVGPGRLRARRQPARSRQRQRNRRGGQRVRIEAVDFFYCAMPEVLDIGDGSQDLLLVRLQAGPHVGWGECEASPLPTIATLVCPMSHSACKPIRASVLGQELETPADVARIGDSVRENSLDLLQADHALSGIDLAMWDLLGRRFGEPVWKLLGIREAQPRRPYASVLFGDEPEETLAKARAIRAEGYRAAKFGWGPYGRGGVEADAVQVAAAREGLGPDGVLLVDAGTVWGEGMAAARERLPALKAAGATWLEEPFVGGAVGAYAALAAESAPVAIAGGEGAHNPWQARHLIDHGGIGFVQIDAGRIGGITPARQVAEYARRQGVVYVNHTFTSHLALSASLQPWADHPAGSICEYPVEPKALAVEATKQHIGRDADGMVRLPEAPGLGIEPDLEALGRYLVPVEIRVGGRTLYETPALTG